MERRRTIVLSTVCAATLFASISCGGKNPTDPTKGATNAPIAGAGGDEVTAQSTSSMRWSLADRCPDGRGLQWRLFDVVNNQHFPASGRYVTPNGGSKTATISCTTNHRICIGGTTYPATTLTFGVGINGTRRTAAVLRSVACRACGPVVQRLMFSCTRGFAPGEDGLVEDDGASAGDVLGFSDDSEDLAEE